MGESRGAGRIAPPMQPSLDSVARTLVVTVDRVHLNCNAPSAGASLTPARSTP
jgi:hypothetical protein